MVEIIRRLLVAGLAVGIIAGNVDEVVRFYDDTVAQARHLATVADLRSISNMLDYEYMKKGCYPQTTDFPDWLRRTFKESPVHELGRDHWGNRLIYQVGPKRKKFDLTSNGPDGFVGTADDLRATGS
ncbi:type II secretion system protein GspG [uncultured Desulfosarcina sp.]|uniref:type II secretion system protein GspG n=1 Tax=uncultured Desulfosarcina sp. TaxID=218289 RepID=UPI0029C8A284|nr:type II secretion system protein GspG [uncultured Desulfosarcina sp.]